MLALGVAALIPATAAPARIVDIPGVPAEVAALIMSGQQGGAIDVRALALPLPSSEAPSAVVVLEVPLADLADPRHPDSIRTELYGYVLDERNRLAGSLSKAFELRPEAGPSMPPGVKAVWSLALRPGRYTVRLLVRDHRSPKMGLAVIGLEVPAADDVAVMAPMIGQSPESWTVLRLDQGPGWGLTEIQPTASPVLPSSQGLVLQALTRNLAEDPQLEVQWTAEDGSVSTGAVQVRSRMPVGRSGMELVDAEIPPSDLEPGRYTLRLAPPAPGTGQAIPVEIVGRTSGRFSWLGGDNPPDTTPTAIPAEATADSGTGTSEEPETRATSNRAKSRQFGRDFSEVMRLASEGRLPEAATRLGNGLRNAFDGNAQAENRVARTERREIRRLTESDPDSLIPIVEVYREAHKQLWRAGSYLLSSHCRRTARVLIDTYMERGGDRETAVAMLTGFALDAQRLGMGEIAEEMLSACLELESREPAVLITLASVEERQGRYGSAVRLMEELLEIDDSQHQARLRLAVNLERRGQSRRAEQHLRAVIGAADGWVRTVAYQELGRKLASARKRREEARKFLEEATKQVPDDEKLHLLLALVHELEDKPWKARAVLDAYRNRQVETRFAARHRYAELPLRELGELRRRVHDRLENGRQQLAAALEISR